MHAKLNYDFSKRNVFQYLYKYNRIECISSIRV